MVGGGSRGEADRPGGVGFNLPFRRVMVGWPGGGEKYYQTEILHTKWFISLSTGKKKTSFGVLTTEKNVADLLAQSSYNKT